MKIRTAFLLLFGGLSLSSCDRYFYAPNKVNIPGLREQGDLNIEAGFSGGFLSEGVELQTSYAIAPSLGIMVNGHLNRSQSDWGTLENREKAMGGRFLEAGLGYFREMETNPNWVFEIYGGAGKGSYFLYRDRIQIFTLEKTRYFLQPTFSYKIPRKNIEFGVASRFSVAQYSGNPWAIPNLEYESYRTEITQLLQDKTKVFWEPSFRFSGGGDAVKFNVGVTPSLLLSQYFETRDVVNVNLGVRFSLTTKKANRRNR